MKTPQTFCNNGAHLLTAYKNLTGYRLSGSSASIRTPLDYRARATMLTRWKAITTAAVLSAVVFLLVAQSRFVIAQTQQPGQQTPRSASEIERMIEWLGSDDFLVRERASEQLLETGSAAISQLKKAQTTLDQEIRDRASDILKAILETDLEQRSTRFLSMPPTSNDDCGFQHWSSFSRLAGTSREARLLLVEIQSDPQSKKLLSRIDLDRRSSDISEEDKKPKPFDDRSVTPSVVTYGAEMYRRSMQPQVTADTQNTLLAGSGIVEELSASAFESNFLSLSPITVQQSQHKLAFLELLTAWLKFELQSSPMTVAKLKLIASYHLRAFANDLAEVLSQPQYPHKQAAIESLGKIFFPTDEDDPSSLENGSDVADAISQLRPFVFSNEVLIRLPQAETMGPVEVTLGDFAFQLMLNMQEKSPKEFGMSEVSGKMLLDNKSIFCFKNREAASESIQAWLANLNESQSKIDQ